LDEQLGERHKLAGDHQTTHKLDILSLRDSYKPVQLRTELFRWPAGEVRSFNISK